MLYDNLVSLGYDWYTSRLKHGEEASGEGEEASWEGEAARVSDEVVKSRGKEVVKNSDGNTVRTKGEMYLTLEWSQDHSDMEDLVLGH